MNIKVVLSVTLSPKSSQKTYYINDNKVLGQIARTIILFSGDFSI